MCWFSLVASAMAAMAQYLLADALNGRRKLCKYRFIPKKLQQVGILLQFKKY
jgi:hypothetical protein